MQHDALPSYPCLKSLTPLSPLYLKEGVSASLPLQDTLSGRKQPPHTTHHPDHCGKRPRQPCVGAAPRLAVEHHQARTCCIVPSCIIRTRAASKHKVCGDIRRHCPCIHISARQGPGCCCGGSGSIKAFTQHCQPHPPILCHCIWGREGRAPGATGHRQQPAQQNNQQEQQTCMQVVSRWCTWLTLLSDTVYASAEQCLLDTVCCCFHTSWHKDS